MIAKLLLTAAAALAALVFSSCHSGTVSQTANRAEPHVRTAVSSDVPALNRYIQLPVRPAAAQWETFDMTAPGSPGLNEWYLLAVLHYTPQEAETIVQQTTISKEPAMLDAREIRPWFPGSLKTAWTDSGDGHLRFPGPAYVARPFYKDTLHDGYFVRSDGGGDILIDLQCCTAQLPPN